MNYVFVEVKQGFIVIKVPEGVRSVNDLINDCRFVLSNVIVRTIRDLIVFVPCIVDLSGPIEGEGQKASPSEVYALLMLRLLMIYNAVLIVRVIQTESIDLTDLCLVDWMNSWPQIQMLSHIKSHSLRSSD